MNEIMSLIGALNDADDDNSITTETKERISEILA